MLAEQCCVQYVSANSARYIIKDFFPMLAEQCCVQYVSANIAVYTTCVY